MRLSQLKTMLAQLGLMLACSSFAMSGARSETLGDFGPAPEIAGIQQWFNSPALSMASLRGKVVLIDFWTYSCINCIRTLPYVSKWHERYKGQGLVVVGVHTPEFPYEREARNLATAIQRFGLSYPVAQDNRYLTWRNYDNQYWPASYLVDRQGKIRMKHAGEGNYEEIERAIRQLLAEPVAR
ncbi:thioredoxin family protein [Janthinobacterium sp.]|uniref:thioredoxin family protein n=1 Tax=Janthinobacterium sp. TaxID=1871054 RepID=UPI00293D67DC|nr:thioredoxin family protein [Janthinobacterium sp.]